MRLLRTAIRLFKSLKSRAYPDRHQWQAYTGMTDAEEEEYIRKAIKAYQSTSPSGKVPVGVSSNTDRHMRCWLILCSGTMAGHLSTPFPLLPRCTRNSVTSYFTGLIPTRTISRIGHACRAERRMKG